MEKIITVNIGGRIIAIESNAFQTHLAYIETLHCHFINEEGRFEIVNDIESRIAELMQEIINNGTACITGTDMDCLIIRTGTAGDFAKLDEEDYNVHINDKDKTTKRLEQNKALYSLVGLWKTGTKKFMLCNN
jgi:hypothetical protein